VPLFRVSDSASERLVGQPESGLGYQLVQYRREKGPLVVFNASTAIPLSELRERKFSEEDYDLLSGNPEMPGSFESLSMDDDYTVVFSQLDPSMRRDSFGLSFTETPVAPSEMAIPSNRPRSYYRYNAYYKDRRITWKGDFVAGTYATTYADMHFVPSGFAAVGRYALPNPASARYIFTLVTFDRPTLMGTAAPNFGQSGGGVEVLFAAGANNRPGTSFPIDVG